MSTSKAFRKIDRRVILRAEGYREFSAASVAQGLQRKDGA
jgi:hypothetical protein